MNNYGRHEPRINGSLLRRFNAVYLCLKLIAICLAILLVIWLRNKPYSATFYALAGVVYFCVFMAMMFANREVYSPVGKAIAYILAVAPAGVLLAHVPNALPILLGIVIMIAVFGFINLFAPQFSLRAEWVMTSGIVVAVAYTIISMWLGWITIGKIWIAAICGLGAIAYIVLFAFIWERASYGVITDENAARNTGPWNFFLDLLPEEMVNG